MSAQERGRTVAAALLAVLSLLLIWGQLVRTDLAAHLFGIAAFAFPGALIALTGRTRLGCAVAVLLLGVMHMWGFADGVGPFVVGVILVPLVLVSLAHAVESVT